MKTIKTTYQVDGCTEPCWVVLSVGVKVRIAKFYHYIGRNTILVSEIFNENGKELVNSEEEIDGDFDSLTASDAVRIAKEHSVYLY